MLASRLKLLFVLWVVAETLVFVAIVHVVGLGWAMLAGLATSLLGAAMLKRAGSAAMLRLRGVLSGRGDGQPGAALDATLRGLAAAALLLPGFLSDIVGLALAAPPLRALAAGRLRGVIAGREDVRRGFGDAPARHGPGAIDLSPEEWSSRTPPTRS